MLAAIHSADPGSTLLGIVIGTGMILVAFALAAAMAAPRQ